MTVADFPDWQAPSAHAAQIATQGVPLLAGSVGVPGRTWSLAGGASSTALPVTFHKIGYEMLAKATIAAAATIPFVRLNLVWTDSGSGLEVATDTFIIPCASGGPKFIVAGRGPTKADTMTATVANLDPAQAITMELDILENGRVYPRDDWGWINQLDAGLTVPTFTLPQLPDDESVLGIVSATTIAASGSNSYLFAQREGIVACTYELTTGAPSALQIRIRGVPDSEYGGGNWLGSYGTPPTTFQFVAPRAPLRVVLANQTTAAIVINFAMVRLVQ